MRPPRLAAWHKLCLLLFLPLLAVAIVFDYLQACAEARNHDAHARALAGALLEAEKTRLETFLIGNSVALESLPAVFRVGSCAELEFRELQLWDARNSLVRSLPLQAASDGSATTGEVEPMHANGMCVTCPLLNADGESRGELRLILTSAPAPVPLLHLNGRGVLCCAFLLIACAPALYFIRRWQSNFLRSLVAAVNRLSHGQSTPPNSSDSAGLGKLAGPFNRMAERLAGQSREITEVRDQALKAAEHARSANEAKSRFLAYVSHEIRTPMTAILGYADLILDEHSSAEERLRHARIIRQNGEHLITILNDILDISKVEAGKMTVERVPTSPHAILQEVAGLLGARARAKKIDLNVQLLTPLPVTVTSDPTRLRQILLNLVGNAIKFTDHGEVRIKAALREPTPGTPYLEFCVADTGIGMSAEVLERLFRPYSQGSTSTPRAFGGTGLGLAISRQLCELMGGRIFVASEVGKGSRFTFRLPTGAIACVPRSQVLPSPGEVVVEERLDPVPALRGRVMVAEDSVDVRTLVALLLRRCGVDVVEVASGRRAIEEFSLQGKRGPGFDLILLDFYLPEMNGDSVASELRKMGYQGMIAALTASSAGEELDRFLKAGCNTFFRKPFDRKEFLEFLRTHLPSANQPDAKEPAKEPDTSSIEYGGMRSLFAGDPEMQEFIEGFLGRLSDMVGEFETALAARDLTSACQIAHRWKGTAGTLGFPEISERAASFETTVKTGTDAEAIATHARALASSCRRALAMPAH